VKRLKNWTWLLLPIKKRHLGSSDLVVLSRLLLSQTKNVLGKGEKLKKKVKKGVGIG